MFFEKCFQKNEKLLLLGKLHSAEKNENWPAIAAVIKLKFPLKMGKDESKLSFIRTSQHFNRALAILELQIYVVSEQFEAEKISLLSGRLVRVLIRITTSRDRPTSASRANFLNMQRTLSKFLLSRCQKIPQTIRITFGNPTFSNSKF